MHPIAWAAAGWLLSLTIIFLMMGWLSSRREARRTYRHCAAGAIMILIILIPIFILDGFLPWPFQTSEVEWRRIARFTPSIQKGKPLTVLTIILKTVGVICALLLTLLILMHKGKGGGFTDSFDNLTGNAGSSGVAERNLNRWTVLTALVWVATILALDLI